MWINKTKYLILILSLLFIGFIWSVNSPTEKIINKNPSILLNTNIINVQGTSIAQDESYLFTDFNGQIHRCDKGPLVEPNARPALGAEYKGIIYWHSTNCPNPNCQKWKETQ